MFFSFLWAGVVLFLIASSECIYTTSWILKNHETIANTLALPGMSGKSLIAGRRSFRLASKSIIKGKPKISNTHKTRPRVCVNISSVSSLETAPWEDLKVPPTELRPASCLTTGQTFSWKKCCEKDEWIGVVGNRVYQIKQTEETTLFRCLHDGDAFGLSSKAKRAKVIAHQQEESLRKFFGLGVSAKSLYDRWSRDDPVIQKVAARLPGTRSLQQNPVECLFSFICSSNNNITRITLMVDRLRRMYGKLLLTTDVAFPELHGALKLDWETSSMSSSTGEGTTPRTYTWYAFPSVECLAEASEEDLRRLGLGYRAINVKTAAKQLLVKGGIDWLESLKSLPRKECQEELLCLRGVGRKVADCVSLFSLNQTECVPIDTHVWQIACRDFKFKQSKVKTLTPQVYEEVGDLFRDRYGPFSGWAHLILFAGELGGENSKEKKRKDNRSRSS